MAMSLLFRGIHQLLREDMLWLGFCLSYPFLSFSFQDVSIVYVTTYPLTLRTGSLPGTVLRASYTLPHSVLSTTL